MSTSLGSAMHIQRSCVRYRVLIDGDPLRRNSSSLPARPGRGLPLRWRRTVVGRAAYPGGVLRGVKR
jgi:hypothetical protein